MERTKREREEEPGSATIEQLFLFGVIWKRDEQLEPWHTTGRGGGGYVPAISTRFSRHHR